MWVHLISGDLSNPWVTVFNIKREYFSHLGMIDLRQGKSGSRTNPGVPFFTEGQKPSGGHDFGQWFDSGRVS